MNIQPINSYNVSMTGKVPEKSGAVKSFAKKIKQKIIDVLPEATFKETPEKIEKWKKFEEFVSRPAENRAIMGATAILLQPTIDACNRDVSDKTRQISINRTISKIVAGTLVGIMVRGSAYKLVQKFTNIEGKGRFSKLLLPKKYLEEFASEPKFLKNHRSALSTLLAMLAMCVTNFAIDAPLTVYLTNKANARTEKKIALKEAKKAEMEVANE